jgi:uncharacterized protein (TIGR03435 family)
MLTAAPWDRACETNNLSRATMFLVRDTRFDCRNTPTNPFYSPRITTAATRVNEKTYFAKKEVDAPVPPAKEGPVNAAVGDRSGRMIGNEATMAGLASALTLFLKRPVVDQTGLKGYYNFDVHWSSPAGPGEQPPSPGLGTEGEGLLISNLQSQFGLRITKLAGPVEYWVVDHVEPPTEN